MRNHENSHAPGLSEGLRTADKRAVTADPHTADAVLLVRPAAFGFHAEAAATNTFARPPASSDVALRALGEFDGFAERLAAARVEVLVLEDSAEPAKSDAIFPNNWVSFHADGTIALYPMA